MRQAHTDYVLLELTFTIKLAVAHQVVRGCDHLLLEFGQRTLLLSTATATAATLLGLAELKTERTDRDEIDIALGGAGIRSRVAILHLCVVGDEVAGFEAEFLEKECVPGSNLRCRTVIEQPNCVFRATIDRVHEKQLGDPVIVVGFRLDIEFLDRSSVLIAPRLGKRHRRRLICEDINNVLGRGWNEVSACPCQSDLVIPLTLDGQTRRPRAVPFVRELHCHTVDEELPAGCEHRREDPQPHYRPAERGDVSAELDRAGSEP